MTPHSELATFVDTCTVSCIFLSYKRLPGYCADIVCLQETELNPTNYIKGFNGDVFQFPIFAICQRLSDSEELCHANRRIT